MKIQKYFGNILSGFNIRPELREDSKKVVQKDLINYQRSDWRSQSDR